jgi:two-component system, chemotaxis family, protein-glutamate methylesterase/glutaminase
MPGHDIVVIGFSAGGIDPLCQLVADLPRDFPASLFVVHHFPPQSVSALPNIVNRAGSLRASQPVDGEAIAPGRIYIGRPDQHMLIRDGHIRLTRGPREHGHRPAIDPLFRTAARSHGSRVIGVILSGTLDDGTAGLLAIKDAGGLALVQDPKETAYPGMALSAIHHVPVDAVAPMAQLGLMIDRLSREPATEIRRSIPRDSEIDPADPEPALVGTAALRENGPPGQPSSFVCPECGGALWESERGGFLHFRCHVGHGYSAETLLANQSDTLEAALWTAVRSLEEKADLARRLAERTRHRGLHRSAERFASTAREAELGSSMIRAALLKAPVTRTLSAPAEPVEPEEASRLTGAGGR